MESPIFMGFDVFLNGAVQHHFMLIRQQFGDQLVIFPATKPSGRSVFSPP